MYLLVIVTLVIGLLSIYGQVLSLQAARLAALQTGFAKTMILWHEGALSMASKVVTSSPTYPCSLTYTLPNGASYLQCVKPTNTPAAQTTGTVTDSSNGLNYLNATEKVHLPDSYATASNQFYSVLYTDASSSAYVLTYVTQPVTSATNPAPGYISLQPNNRLTSVTMTDLQRQLKNSGLPNYAYGTVKLTGGVYTLVTFGSLHGSGGTIYTIPSTVGSVMGPGAIAIIASP